jgi:hypothetical protein
MPTPQEMVGFLQSQGMSQMAAMALVARWQQESGQKLNPTIVGDAGISQGMGQWNRERLANLKASGMDWTDPYNQARFALSEMGYGDTRYPGYGSERRAGDMLRNAKTSQEALYGAMGYERPQDFTWANPAGGHGYGNTVANYNALSGGQPVAVADAGPKAGEASVADYRAGNVKEGQPVYVGGAPVVAANETPAPVQGPPMPTAMAAASPAGDKKGWRNALAKGMAGFKLPNVAKSDIGGLPMMPGAAARVDTPEMATLDPNQIAQQRQDLAMAMQKLNSGRLWL